MGRSAKVCQVYHKWIFSRVMFMKTIIWIQKSFPDPYPYLPEFQWLNVDVDILVSECRRHSSYRNTKSIKLRDAKRIGNEHGSSGYCERCLEFHSLEIHHANPLWALALNTVCETLLAGKDIREFVQFACWVEPVFASEKFPAWNSTENTIALCKKCHTLVESSGEKLHRNNLLRKYAPFLHFSENDAKRTYRKFWNHHGEMLHVH